MRAADGGTVPVARFTPQHDRGANRETGRKVPNTARLGSAGHRTVTGVSLADDLGADLGQWLPVGR